MPPLKLMETQMSNPFSKFTDADLDEYIAWNRLRQSHWERRGDDPAEAGVYAIRASAAEAERARRQKEAA